MPRKGMQYERCVMIIANPYTEDSLKKYNSIEMLLPKTGEVIFLTKLPQSLYTPGMFEWRQLMRKVVFSFQPDPTQTRPYNHRR